MNLSAKVIRLVMGSLFVTGMLHIPVFAQQFHPDFIHPTQWLELADDHFTQELYPLVISSEDEYLDEVSQDPAYLSPQETQAKLRYMKAYALLQQDHPGAADSARAFLNDYRFYPAYTQRVAFALARHHFRKRELHAAIPYYEMASSANLTNKELTAANFERAYCYFNNREFQKAEIYFATVIDIPGKYYAPANYYYGLLAYHNGKNEAALAAFKKISDESYYRKVVPYYVAEIYYFKGERKKALEEALKLINRKEKLYYDKELHLLAAQILFEEERYGDALPYFEHYYDHTDYIRKEELYEMAYSYYRVEEWENAIEKFRPLSNSHDSLGQTAMYLLGDCYLKIRDKKGARNAFGFCADMNYNAVHQENALMLYSMLSAELGYYTDATSGLNNLLLLFPETAYKTEAKTLLSTLYLRSRDYEKAYQALAQGNDNYPGYRDAMQKVAFGYAMLQLQNDNIPFAERLLETSLAYPENADYKAAAHFWMGEIQLRAGYPTKSISHFEQYLRANGNAELISRQAATAQAYLSLGYAYLQANDFTRAEQYFQLAREDAYASHDIIQNSLLRHGDATYLQQKYKEALAFYEQVIQAGYEEADYAQIQKARILGLQGKSKEKHNLLRNLLQKPSAYAREARYELGNSLIETDQYQQAIKTLEPLTGAEGKDFAAKAWIKTGFAWQALKNNTKAIEAYKAVLTHFPGAEEKQTALDALQSIYTEQNQPEKYAALLQEFPDASSDAQKRLDSTYYAAAEAQIASGNWSEAQKALTNYLQNFPQGAFHIKARYYLAESYYQQKNVNKAVAFYDSVLHYPWNEFTESSARRAAEILFKQKNYTEAATYYLTLKNNAMSKDMLQAAYSGLLQSAFEKGDYALAERYADTLLNFSDPGDLAMNEVLFFKARTLQLQGKTTDALALYRQLIDTYHQTISVEAGYRIAQILFTENNLKEAEEAAVAHIKFAEGNEYWVIKSYLLLADILTAQKDYFNAKATLQSIIKNAQDSSLKAEANQKLKNVISLEKQDSKLQDE